MSLRDDIFNADPVTERHRLSREARVYMEPIRKRARRYAGDPVRRILDIGCGSGEITIVLREVFPEAEVVGVDRDQQALFVGKRIADERGISGIEYVAADAERKLPEGPFDLVLASMVFYHSRWPSRLLANIHAALAPDGRLWTRDPLRSKRDENLLYKQRLLHAFLSATEALSADPDIASRLPEHLAQAGFSSVETEIEEYPLGGPTTSGQDLAVTIIEAAYQARALVSSISGLTDEEIQEMHREALRALACHGDTPLGTQTVVNHMSRKR